MNYNLDNTSQDLILSRKMKSEISLFRGSSKIIQRKICDFREILDTRHRILDTHISYLISHISLLITHYSLLITHYSLLTSHYYKMLHGHGNDAYRYKQEIKYDFSSNVWYEGMPEALRHYLQQQLGSIESYPEPDAATFCRQAADYFALPQGSCLAYNGTAEAFYALARLFEGQRSTVHVPAFAEYEDAARQFKHRLSFLSNTTLKEAMVFDSKLVWLGNPNNPDGKIIPLSLLRSWLLSNPQSLFVVDEAYADFGVGFESAIGLLQEFPNLVVVKSFTKSFAIPGLRLGIVLAKPERIQNLAAMQAPWTVNSLAQRAGSFILAHYTDLLFDREQMHTQSQDMQSKLQALRGVEVYPSPTNYCLCRLRDGRSADLKAFLVEEHGILIRDASNFRGLSPQHFRVALQSAEAMRALLTGIEEFIQNRC